MNFLRGDDVGEGVLRSGSEAWYLGPHTMSPSGHSQFSPSPAQKKSKDLAVELACLDVLDETRDLALEAIGELVGRGGFGVELLDELLSAASVELVGLDSLLGVGDRVSERRPARVVHLLSLDSSEDDAFIVGEVVAARGGEIRLRHFEFLRARRELGLRQPAFQRRTSRTV